MLERETLVVAVSGGVDSAVLLDMLATDPTARLIIAHVDHGIRTDSHEDAKLTKRVAEKYGLAHEMTELHLGPRASEQEAREKRYAWLDMIRKKYHASAVVTAHHQDDLLETIILNLRRGTGWRGLCSLRETQIRRRPLLAMTKTDIVTYAIEHRLEWREDSTNDNLRYTRNYIRQGIVPRLSGKARETLLELYRSQLELRQDIEQETSALQQLVEDGQGLSRYWLIMLPEEVAMELLRTVYGGTLLTSQLRQLLYFAKVARVGATLQAGSSVVVRTSKSRLILERGGGRASKAVKNM